MDLKMKYQTHVLEAVRVVKKQLLSADLTKEEETSLKRYLPNSDRRVKRIQELGPKAVGEMFLICHQQPSEDQSEVQSFGETVNMEIERIIALRELQEKEEQQRKALATLTPKDQTVTTRSVAARRAAEDAKAQALSQAQAEDKTLEELSEPKTSESNQPEANDNLEWDYGAAASNAKTWADEIDLTWKKPSSGSGDSMVTCIESAMETNTGTRTVPQ